MLLASVASVTLLVLLSEVTPLRRGEGRESFGCDVEKEVGFFGFSTNRVGINREVQG